MLSLQQSHVLTKSAGWPLCIALPSFDHLQYERENTLCTCVHCSWTTSSQFSSLHTLAFKRLQCMQRCLSVQCKRRPSLTLVRLQESGYTGLGKRRLMCGKHMTRDWQYDCYVHKAIPNWFNVSWIAYRSKTWPNRQAKKIEIKMTTNFSWMY